LNLEKSILKTLAYFDIFLHPLKAEEIRLFCDQPVLQDELLSVLDEMVQKEMVFKLGAFYSLQNNPLLVERRLKGNELADKMLQTAYRIASFLHKFPFVRGVGISGSLSKNYADAGTDIDFFIITSNNRLWIARSLMHAVKKLSFLVGRQDWFCMNYFIDGEALVIAEENIFTATEVVTLKPVCSNDGFAGFFTANYWAGRYFPNHFSVNNCVNSSATNPWYKTAGEKLLNNAAGRMLDDYLMRITARRWQKKEEHHKLNMKGEPIGLRIGKHVARPNPEHLQKKLLNLFASRLRGIEMKYGIVIESDDHFFRKEII